MAARQTAAFTSLVSVNEKNLVTDGESQIPLHLKNNQQKLKKFVRKADWTISHPIRQNLWKDLCLQTKQPGPSVYNDVAENGGQAEGVNLPQFVDESHAPYYKLNDQGQQISRKIIFAIENAHPEITYCPLLLPLASALLHYIEEPVCFECLVAILQEQRLKFLHQTRVEYEAFVMNFDRISAKFIPQAHSYLKAQKGSTDFFKSWIWLIFEALPFTHLVRVVDCFLVEGLKIFYRVGLAIAESYYKNAATNPDDLMPSIQEYLKNLTDSPQKLLKTAFQYRGFSKATIKSIQSKNQQKVRSNMHELQRPQSLSHNITVETHLDSKIISQTQLQVIWKWLPTRIALMKPELIFSTSEHGYSLISLYNQCQENEPLLLLVKTVEKEVFGAYLSTNLNERNNKERKLAFFGTGESFLFSVVPEAKKYSWVGTEKETCETFNQMFIRAAHNLLVVGGGDGDGIHLKSDLNYGWTSCCQTFDNEPLASTNQFQCAEVEVISIVSDD